MTIPKFKFEFGLYLALSLVVNFSSAQAAEVSFDYPELSVVPLSSDRVESEAVGERERALRTNLPFLIPASVTFLTGAALLGRGTKAETHSDESAKVAPWVGMGVGAVWWGLSLGLIQHLDPYSTGAGTLAKTPAKAQREKLSRERKAEEVINQAGSLARKLKWISIVSNVGASAFMTASAKDKSFSKFLAIGSVLSSFTPLLFPHHWETVEAQQRDYKKRIYAPVLGAALLPNPTGNEFSPGLTLALQF